MTNQARHSLSRIVDGLRSEAPFISVLAVVAIGFGSLLLFPGHWLRASAVIAFALIYAGALRLALPPRHAGLLAIRAKWLDVASYTTLGLVIIITGLLLPR